MNKHNSNIGQKRVRIDYQHLRSGESISCLIIIVIIIIVVLYYVCFFGNLLFSYHFSY